MRSYPGNPDDRLDLCRFHVSLDTTSHCNLRCRHCWMETVRALGYSFRNEVMPFDLFQKICNDFVGRSKSFGPSCGHEPLLNKNFPQYVRYAVELGLPDVHFYSNGTLFTPQVAAELVAAGPERIVFSLEGATEETFRDIRNGATLEKLLTALRMVHDEKVRQGKDKPLLRLNWVLMPRNLGELTRLAQLAYEHHCAEIFLIPHLRWRHGAMENEPPVTENLEETRSHLRAFHQRCDEFGIRVVEEMLLDALPDAPAPQEAPNAAEARGEEKAGLRKLVRRILRRDEPPTPVVAMPYCVQPWDMMVITSVGTIMPCTGVLVDRPYGDFRTHSLQEIWDSESYRALRAGLRGLQNPCNHCENCSHFSLNNKGEDFHKVRDLDVEKLQGVLPTIVRKKNTATP